MSAATLNGDKFLFRKDSTDTGTLTNMTDRVTYEFVNSGEVTIDPTTDIACGSDSTGHYAQIAETGHGLSTGDWVYCFHHEIADAQGLTLAGLYQITKVDNDNFKIYDDNFDSYSPGANDVTRYVTATVTTDVPVWIGFDGNHSQRNGNPDDIAITTTSAGFRRLGGCLNSSMRLTTASSWVPWLNAISGDVGGNRIVVYSANSDSSTGEVVLPNFTGYSLFVNSVKRVASASASMVADVRPSRVVMSYNNYPEIFDNPFATNEGLSDSIIDVSSADGEQITGIIPFYGESAFTSAQGEGNILVFKENSIHVVSIGAKLQNQVAAYKLDSNGIGCTAPHSIAVTRQGIMFASESGIYRVDKDLRVTYIGEKLERKYAQDTELATREFMAGHAAGVERKYKLSYTSAAAAAEATENSRVFVYDYTRESAQSKVGSWTIYDNHPVVMWCNLQNVEYFSTSKGTVNSIRNLESIYDYQDGADAIAAEITLAPTDLGDRGIRKLVTSMGLNFRNVYNMAATQASVSINLSNNFQPLAGFIIETQADELNGLSDTYDRRIETLRFTLPRRRGMFVQLKLENYGLHEPMEFVGVDWRVMGLSHLGIKDASDTI